MTTVDETAREAAALHLWDEGIIRPESLAREVVDFLIREGHVVLSTPPADDVREALAEVIEENRTWTRRLSDGYLSSGSNDGIAIADAVLRDPRFEVLPRGAVTDAEVQCPHWSPGSITKRAGCTACAALEVAREVRS